MFKFRVPFAGMHGESGSYTLTCESLESTSANRIASTVLNVDVVYECADLNPASFNHFAVNVGETNRAEINYATAASPNCTQPFTYTLNTLPQNVESDDIYLDLSEPGKVYLEASPDMSDDGGVHRISIRACATYGGVNYCIDSIEPYGTVTINEPTNPCETAMLEGTLGELGNNPLLITPQLT